VLNNIVVDKQPIDFGKAMKDIKLMLNTVFEIKQVQDFYDYEGEDITHSSVLATNNNIKDSVSKEGAIYNMRQNRGMLDVILSKVFQLGYAQRAIEEDNDEAKNLMLEVARNYIKELKKQNDEKNKG
jgi:hypothetical protein